MGKHKLSYLLTYLFTYLLIEFCCCNMPVIFYPCDHFRQNVAINLNLSFVIAVIHRHLSFVLEFKFEGFTADTCRSLVALKDVSFKTRSATFCGPLISRSTT